MADAGAESDDGNIPINNWETNNEPSNNQGDCHVRSLKSFKNRCALEHEFETSQETGELGSVPQDLGLQVAWTYENQCPGFYAVPVTDMVFQGNTLSAQGDGYLVTVDRTNGQELGCVYLGGGFRYSILTVVSGLSQVFAFAVESYFLVPIEDAIQWRFLEPLNPDMSVTGARPGCGGHTAVRLTPDGQFIAATDQPHGITSVDPLTGQTNWVVDDAELYSYSTLGEGVWLSPLDMGFDKATREVIIQIEPGVVVGVDSCGQITRRPTAIAATVVAFGTEHLEVTRGRLKVVAGSGEVLSDETCGQIVSLAQDVVTCIKFRDKAIILSIHQIGQLKKVVTLPPTIASDMSPMIATRDGVLVIPNATGLHFYDWRTDRSIGTHQFESPSSTRLHDIDTNGQIIISSLDKIIAIDSMLTGLAPGPFPRGFDTAPPGTLVPW